MRMRVGNVYIYIYINHCMKEILDSANNILYLKKRKLESFIMEWCMFPLHAMFASFLKSKAAAYQVIELK